MVSSISSILSRSSHLLSLGQHVHFTAYAQPTEEARSSRDKKWADEAQRHADAEEARKRAAEDEERRRILDDAKMEAEAKPGMVWNKEARD